MKSLKEFVNENKYEDFRKRLAKSLSEKSEDELKEMLLYYKDLTGMTDPMSIVYQPIYVVKQIEKKMSKEDMDKFMDEQVGDKFKKHYEDDWTNVSDMIGHYIHDIVVTCEVDSNLKAILNKYWKY